MDMTTRRQIQWVRVEYQPDLQTPKVPVPMGVIVAENFPGSHTAGVVIIGREPRDPKNPPAKLKETKDLGFAQLIGWVSGVARDILAAPQADFFSHVSSKWRWNLYVAETESLEVATGTSLLELAGRLYTRHVGEEIPDLPIVRKAPPRRRRTTVWDRREAAVPLPVAAAPAS